MEIVTIPYSQHFRNSAEMFGSSAIQQVFTYLLDEHLMLVRKGQQPNVKFSCNSLETKCGVHRHTIKKILQQLEKDMRIISITGNIVNIDINLYGSLLHCFYGLSKEERKTFSEALLIGDFCTIKKLGFVKLDDFCTTIESLSGKVVQISTTGDDTNTPCTNFDNKVVQKSTTKDISISHIVEICTTQIESLLSNCTNFDKKDYIKRCIDEFFHGELDNDAINGLSDAILYKKHQLSTENELSIFVQLFSKMLSKFVQPLVEISTTENNIVNNKKINQQAGEFSENFEPSETEETFDELPDNLPKIKKGGKHFQKVEYPYFPASEVLEFIQDIHQCLDNDVKLFLYNFNQEIHARYDQDAEYDDETGEEIKPQATVDTSQLILSKSEVEDIASTAISNTRADITDKDIYVNDELVSITATDNLDRLTKFNIIDWQFELVGNGEKVCQVDWSRIQNPDEAPLENLQSFSKRSRRTREGEVNTERELNKRYIASIIEHSAEDETWDKLSPMEKLIYNFLCDHFEFSEDGLEVIDVKEDKKYLNRNMLFQYFSKELNSRPDTPSQEDFFSTFAKDKPDTYGGIKLRPSMFSAIKIQRWNAKHGFQSVISPSDIQVTTEEEKVAQKA